MEDETKIHIVSPEALRDMFAAQSSWDMGSELSEKVAVSILKLVREEYPESEPQQYLGVMFVIAATMPATLAKILNATFNTHIYGNSVLIAGLLGDAVKQVLDHSKKQLSDGGGRDVGDTLN